MTDWKAIGESKDFWSGVIFLGVGVAFVGLGRHYPMGTTMRMGPGYFPMVLGGLLASIGFILMVRALLGQGRAWGAWHTTKSLW